MKNKVFLGGTCANSTWRDTIIPLLNKSYFNPVVEEWTEDDQAEEIRQKNDECDVHLYVITPLMKGVFSIAEAVESAVTTGKTCVFCVLDEDVNSNGRDISFSPGEKKSLTATAALIERYGGIIAWSLDDVVRVINKL